MRQMVNQSIFEVIPSEKPSQTDVSGREEVGGFGYSGRLESPGGVVYKGIVA
jgi:hypothetical protein